MSIIIIIIMTTLPSKESWIDPAADIIESGLLKPKVALTSDWLKNIARIANAVPVTLYSRVTLNVDIVILNCQKCNQCLKGHKGALWRCSLTVFVFVIVFAFVFVFLMIFFCQGMSNNHSDHMSQRSQVSIITLWMCSLNVFVFVIVFVFVFVLVMIFFWSGHVS